MQKIWLTILSFLSFTEVMYANTVGGEDNIWMNDIGTPTTKIREIKNNVKTNFSSDFKVTYTNTPLGSLSMQSKMNCKTGEIDFTAGIETFINDLIQLFTNGNPEEMLNQLKYQTLIDLIINTIARIHYSYTKDGLNFGGMMSMFDLKSVKACVTDRVRSAFQGEVQGGVKTGGEDIAHMAFGVNFIEFMGIYSCFTFTNDGSLEKDQWEKSHKWARHFVYKIINQSFDLGGMLNINFEDPSCKEWMEYVNKAKTSPTDNPYLRELKEKTWDKATDKINSMEEFYKKGNDVIYSKVDMVTNQKELSSDLLGGGYRTEVPQHHEKIVGIETNETSQQAEEVEAEGLEAEETLKKSGSLTAAKKSEAEGKKTAKNNKVVREGEFEIVVKYEVNTDMIDVFQYQEKDNKEVFSNIYDEIKMKNKGAKRYGQIEKNITEKLFSIKKVQKNQVRILKTIYEDIKKLKSGLTSANQVQTYCASSTGFKADFDGLERESDLKMNLNEMLSLMSEQAEKKYNLENGILTEKEYTAIINSSTTYDETTNQPQINKEALIKNAIKFKLLKEQNKTYEYLYTVDGRPSYVTLSSFLSKKQGKLLFEEDEEVFLVPKKDHPNQKNQTEQREIILENTKILICLNAFNEGRETPFNYTLNQIENLAVLNYYEFLLGNIELYDLARALYELESPIHLLVFLRRGTSDVQKEQLYDTSYIPNNQSYFELPDKMFYSLKNTGLKGLTKAELTYGVKYIKYLKKEVILKMMEIHAQMYAELNSAMQQKNRNTSSEAIDSVELKYNFALLKHFMLKRLEMLKLLMDEK